jgi:hypothetical protein
MKTIFLNCVVLLMAWSAYSAEPAQTPALTAPTVVSTNTAEELPTGPDIFGVFVGRTPCQELARQMNVTVSDECIKRKWVVVLREDPTTHVPTTYDLYGSGYRPVPRTGKWTIAKGTKADPKAIVYQLDPDPSGSFISFLKADDNVLLFLGKNGSPLVGNIYFSYALNRVPEK